MTTFEFQAEYTLDEASELLYYLKKHCASCGAPLWRKGWHNKFLGHHLSLCNACGLKYNKGQYCPICMYVYNIYDVRLRSNDCVKCINCYKYAHASCVQQSNLLSYLCPACTETDTEEDDDVYY